MDEKAQKSDKNVIYEGSRKVLELGSSKSVTLPRYNQLAKQVEVLLGPIKKALTAKVFIDTDGLPVWQYKVVLEVDNNEVEISNSGDEASSK